MPFRDAYKTVGRLVNQCIKADETLETMTMRDFAAISINLGMMFTTRSTCVPAWLNAR